MSSNADDDFEKAMRGFVDQEMDRLIDQGIPPQPEDEQYVGRLVESSVEHAMPEVLKREDWTRRLLVVGLAKASPAQLREIAQLALQGGHPELAEELERLAALRSTNA